MRLHEKRHIDLPIEEVFSYVSDFANTEQWDPGVSSARQLDDGPVAVGTKYDVVATFGSSEVPIVYEVTELEPYRRVVLVGSSETVDAVDEIRFEPADGGTLVDYTADLTFNNWIRFVAPAMAPLMNRVGEKALDGLVATLNG